MREDEIRKAVRENYGKIAAQADKKCCGTSASCCGGNAARMISINVGYSEEDLNAVPEGANLGLGCGNPVALASLKEGETVLDLGAGAGFDCFLAANRVGRHGRVIGVDMTPEMLEKARENATKGDYHNIEFRLGEIENLPVADNSVDAIISNCVINLSSDKKKVFQETFRVLKPGGRLMVSDIVLLKELPPAIKNSIRAYVGCIAGAELKEDYLGTIAAAGFQDIRVVEESAYAIDCMANDPTAQIAIDKVKAPQSEIEAAAASVLSVKVHARKPG